MAGYTIKLGKYERSDMNRKRLMEKVTPAEIAYIELLCLLYDLLIH